MSADQNQRRLTAGLSAVGAGAGAAGLGYAGYKVGQEATKLPRSLGVGRRLVRAAGKEKFGAALVPLEVAGLAGEVMSTKILHGDTKRQPGGVVTKSAYGSGGQAGRRIVEPPREQVERRDQDEPVGKSVVGVLAKVPKEAKAVAGAKPELADIRRRALSSLQASISSAENAKGTVIKAARHPDGDSVSSMGIDGAFHGQAAASHLERAKLHRQRGDQLHMEAIEEESALKRRQALAHLRQAALLEASAKQRVGSAARSLGLSDGMSAAGLKAGGDKGSVKKARRFDPEADRQRRLGAYAGIAAGSGIVTGEAARRHFAVVKPNAVTGGGIAARKVTRESGRLATRYGHGRLGLGLAATSAGLGALAAGTYKRGISRRNRPYT